jgi:hypothetical protein
LLLPGRQRERVQGASGGAEANNKNVLQSSLSDEELMTMFASQHKTLMEYLHQPDGIEGISVKT